MSGKVRLKENGYLDEDPMTLQDIIYKYICENLDVISSPNMCGTLRQLNEGIVLPNDICDRLLKACQRFRRQLSDDVLNIFQDRTRTSLKIVHLRNSTLTNTGEKCSSFITIFKENAIGDDICKIENLYEI